MITNLTSTDIHTSVYQYYNGAWDWEEEHPPLRVAMVAAFFPGFRLSVKDALVDDYINDDYAVGREAACILNDFLSKGFPIRPSRAICEPNSDYGLTLEWYPSNPIYIYSPASYLMIYACFSAYLEKFVNSDNISDEFKMCFYPLYLSEVVNHVPDSYQYKNPKILSSKIFFDNFESPDKTIIQTHGAIFQFDNSSNCPMNNFYNYQLKNLIKSSI